MVKAMNILITGINFYPELISTGKYTSELAFWLAAHGWDVRVVTAPPYYPEWKVQPGYFSWKYQREEINGVTVYRCPLWVPPRVSGVTRILHLLSFTISSFPVLVGQAKWKPNVILCIAPTLLSAPATLLTARLARTQAWLHLQDFELDAAINMQILSTGNQGKKIAAKVEYWLLESFYRITTISKRMQTHLIQKGIPPKQTFLFPNWVDTEIIYPLPVEQMTLRKKLGIPDDKVVVLYAGNMGHKQGLEHVIHAAEQLQNHHKIIFILIGDGVARPDLEKESTNLANIQFFPLQPLKALNQVLNMADIHLLPQKAGAADLVMPSKLSGILASGKAVIATANSDTEIAEIVSNIGIIVPPENSRALAEAILSLVENPALRFSLGEKGRSWVKTHWAKKKVLADFCTQLANNA